MDFNFDLIISIKRDPNIEVNNLYFHIRSMFKRACSLLLSLTT